MELATITCQNIRNSREVRRSKCHSDAEEEGKGEGLRGEGFKVEVVVVVVTDYERAGKLSEMNQNSKGSRVGRSNLYRSQ